jgi:hypothetical protein
MTRWTKMMSLVAVAICSGMTISATNARAEEAEETATSAEAIVDDINDNLNLEISTEDAASRVDIIDPNSYRRDYRGCYSYCDDLRNSCMRRYYSGYDRWRSGGRRRWDGRHHRYDAYRRCERRFDNCLDSCRDRRW